MAAVLEDGYALQYLHNPSEAVIARALERSPGVIEYIKRAWVEAPVEDAEELTVEELEKRLGHRIKIVGNSNGHSREESP